METIRQVLMRRDGLSDIEAEERINEARIALEDYLDEGNEDAAGEVCSEFFGLEPDYLMELLT